MRRALRLGLVGVLAALASTAGRAADPPVLERIDPPGVRVGETATWTVTGRGLAGVERFLIADAGIQAVAAGPAADTAIRLKIRAGPEASPGFHELRAIGPGGISNLLLFRVDTLPEAREAEPNDDRDAANPIALPSAAAGVMEAQDVDWYAFQGRAGQRVTIEVEARRLGAPVVPVVRLLGPSGVPLALSQPLRHGGGDCRLSCVLPGVGRYGVEVHDALYRGGPKAAYRLRVDSGPFATGLFPLGGRRGETIRVAACGGSLTAPWFKAVTLPDAVGALVDPGIFTGPGGSLLIPGRLITGDGPELEEPAASSGPSMTPARLPFGATVNGRIDHPGAVDRYAVTVPAGEGAQVEVQAAALGSWLDSVVTVYDARGRVIAEADDRGVAGLGVGGVGLDGAARDSLVELEPRGPSELVVAITDRFGEGGPEYAYRLAVGPLRGDFAVALPKGVGDWGALNMQPGATVALPLRINATGRPGPIAVGALGLPPGVAAEALTVRIARPMGRQAAQEAGQAEATLVLRVAAGARPAVGSFQIVAAARRADGSKLTRRASATVVLSSLAPDDPRPPPARVVTEFPVAIVVAPER
jgi:hypothetical protein